MPAILLALLARNGVSSLVCQVIFHKVSFTSTGHYTISQQVCKQFSLEPHELNRRLKKEQTSQEENEIVTQPTPIYILLYNYPLSALYFLQIVSSSVTVRGLVPDMLKTLGISLKRQTIFPILYYQNSNKHFHSLLIKKVSNYKKEYITKGAVY